MRSYAILCLFAFAACTSPPSNPDNPELDDTGDDGKADDGGLGQTTGCPFTSEPQYKAVFAMAGTTPDLTVENELRRLVRAAVPGSTVRISVYGFSRHVVADEVIAAGQRGVDIRVVVDGLNRFESPKGSGVYVPFSALQSIRTALGDDAVVICHDGETPVHLHGGCIASGINHNKLAVFSELCDGSHDVVYQSSSNFSADQNLAQQNAVIVRDDPALYAGYLDYWNAEAAQVPIPDYYRQIPGTQTLAYLSPRPRTTLSVRDPATDPVHDILGRVSCAGGTRIRVAMAYWHDARDYLADDLARLHGEGCDVGIASNTEITDAGVKAKIVAAFSSDEARFLPHVHSKYFFVDGMYDGAKRQLVWTGSHNWDYGALRTNEEAILRVDDPAVFAAFDANWNAIWATSTP